MPSAMVGLIGIVTGSPAASDGAKAEAPVDCTPMMRISRPSCRARSLSAMAVPEMSPPPPMGTSTVSTSGVCSSTSSPTVPCPAMIDGWSYGGTNIPPVSRTNSRAAARVSWNTSPRSRMSAP